MHLPNGQNNLFLNGKVFPKYSEIIFPYEDTKKVMCTGNFPYDAIRWENSTHFLKITKQERQAN